MTKIITDKQFIDCVNNFNFIYAKTYTNFAPHEYIVAEAGTKELETIRSLNKYIQEHKSKEKENFFNKEYYVVFIGEYKYWSMDDWDKTFILNRNWDFKNADGTINKSITESKKGL